MDGAWWQRPSGQEPRMQPRPHHPIIQSSNEDNKIAFEAGAVESQLPPKSDIGLIDSQGLSQDALQSTCSIPEHNTDQPSPSLNKCAKARTGSDSKKRKSPIDGVFVQGKRARLDEGTGRPQSSSSWQLPAEIWQHIFTFLAPKMLGRLLSVDKCFHSFLNPPSNHLYDASLPVLTGSLSILQPEVIWQLSRRCFWPTMPAPLQGRTELQMWQLACQRRCQFCGRTGQVSPLHARDPPNGEHKYTGPRPIWPFALRSCESCLVDRTIKVDLLLSSVPSCLIPALPFIFISDNMQIISSAMLQARLGNLELSITKAFFSSHVATIQEEFASAKAMGEATAEEWLKGLEGRGKEHLVDSLRWEKFEMFGGLVRIRQHLSSDNTKADHKTYEAIKVPTPSTAAISDGIQDVLEETPRNLTAPVNALRNKTREKAESLKATRRAEIEKRAAKLKPPLPPHVLALIPSFQAAIQITSPLDDAAWGLLKHRLMAQREDANQHKELEPSTDARAALKQPEDPQNLHRLELEAKQKVNKSWDDAQAPLRAQISELADHFIRDSWRNGRKINKESSPQFAVEVLLYVRSQFYAKIEKDDMALRAAGKKPRSDALSGPFTRKLTLENMRWLFDVKIKPFTQSHRKELFYCHGCEASNKLYGFEAVVQHYAAKHTSSLSLGSVVVHWRAEWPEVPPFHPTPHILNNQLARVPKQKPHGVKLPLIPPTPQRQPLHQEGVVPNYEQLIPHTQYDGIPMQHIHGQIYPYMPPLDQYAHPHHDQALHDPSNLPSNETVYQQLPGVFADEGLFGPLHDVNAGNQQIHSYIPYENYAVPEFQPPFQVRLPNEHDVKLQDIARNSRDLWFSLSPLKGLPGHIRIFIVIHHVCIRFREHFSEEPSVNLFMDGLSNNKEMRPIRSINGLQCKACCLGLGIRTTSTKDKKSYSLPQLVRHFYQRHIEEQHALGAPILDWSTDMIYLPDLRILSNLGSLTNMDDWKLSLIRTALPVATLSNSPSIPNPGNIATHAHDRKPSALKRPSSATHGSNKRALVQRPSIPHKDDLQQNNRDLALRSVSEIIPKANHPTSCSTDLGNSKVENKSFLSEANFQSSKTTASALATPETNPSVENSSLRPPSAITEDDEDGDFDLLAGLESQLDRQASSIHQ
ncbi:hypothetical protein F4678DRAFT_264419 [Xylaria arbuscula]|nr:hypothetical protein F4678DRAFT_264419 [Xylaria arbuscula]